MKTTHITQARRPALINPDDRDMIPLPWWFLAVMAAVTVACFLATWALLELHEFFH